MSENTGSETDDDFARYAKASASELDINPLYFKKREAIREEIDRIDSIVAAVEKAKVTSISDDDRELVRSRAALEQELSTLLQQEVVERMQHIPWPDVDPVAAEVDAMPAVSKDELAKMRADVSSAMREIKAASTALSELGSHHIQNIGHLERATSYDDIENKKKSEDISRMTW